MLQLHDGCWVGKISVSPQNWKTAKSSIKRKWKVQYYFHDPAYKNKYPKGKYVPVKGGLNFIKDHDQRVVAAEELLKEVEYFLKRGYNPITGKMPPPPQIDENGEERPTANDETLVVDSDSDPDPLNENTPFCQALRLALQRAEFVPKTKKDIANYLNFIELAATKIKLIEKPISTVKRKDIRLLLDTLPAVKKYWSNNTFNANRKYLKILFDILNEYEATEIDPVTKIKVKVTIGEESREVLTPEQRVLVNDYLKKHDYPFWRAVHIFFHSGARETEIMKVQAKHVDLAAQTFTVLSKKGRSKKWIWTKKAIKNTVLPLWKELLGNCGPEDYIFSRGLKPGPGAIRPDQFTKRWYRIKKKLGITADFYALKHLHSTELTDEIDNQAAAAANGHTTTTMVDKVYDIKSKKRLLEKVKTANNQFAYAEN